MGKSFPRPSWLASYHSGKLLGRANPAVSDASASDGARVPSEVTEPYSRGDLDDLRGGTFKIILASTPLIVVLSSLLFVSEYGREQANLTTLPPIFASLAAASYLVATRHRLAAAWLFITGYSAIVGAAVLLYRAGSLADLTSLAVLIAAASLGPIAGIATAALETLIVAYCYFAPGSLFPGRCRDRRLARLDRRCACLAARPAN